MPPEFPKRRPKSGHRGSATIMLVVLLCSVASTVFLHRFVFALYVIRGSSMVPALSDGDTALVNMLVHRLGQLERGEIVLVRDGFEDYATKRIVGLPGERVEIRQGRVHIDGQLLSETYLAKDTVTTSSRSTYVLRANEYFVLGDNRSDSFDSRIYGPVARNAIMGSYSRTFWACR